MDPVRRSLVAGLASVPALSLLSTGRAWGADPLKISHQFPGGTDKEGDFRDKISRRFAQEIDIIERRVGAEEWH